MATIEIDISNAAIAQAISDTVLSKLQNPAPLYRIWAVRIDAIVVGAFRSESVPYSGESWPELAPITQQLTPKRRGKLRVTNGLYDSFSVSATGDGITAAFNQRVGQYNLGAIHQFGATVPITAKSRAFFWYRFKGTGNPAWVGLAAKRTDTAIIPARRMLPLQPNGEPMPEMVEDFKELTLRWLLAQ
jgi:phage gpG-like protein